MNEAPQGETRIPNRVIVPFYSAIFRLYPNVSSIQEEFNEEKKRFSCTIQLRKSIDTAQEEAIQGGILEIIQRDILPVLPAGFTTTLVDITIINPELTQEERINNACIAVEDAFKRDGIRVAYEMQQNTVVFTVYGAARPDYAAIRGIVEHEIPHTLPCRMEYKPLVEWEEDKSVADAVRRANDAFAEVEVPSRVGVFSGIGLTLAQIMEVLRTKISPPN